MVRQSPLVGRAVERAGLAEALAGCRHGTGGIVVVSGDAGAGKTRLVAEALCGWDGQVLRGAATTGIGAYAPIVDVLRIATDRHGVDVLHPYARMLLPELGEPSGDADPAGLVAAVRRTLCDIARDAPTVVVLEDLHWAQAATVDMLPALAASLGGEPLLLIATYRGEELPRAHPVRAMRSELRRAGCLVEVPLGPLDRAETADLLCALLGATPSDDVVRSLHERSAGLPFFVEELAGALVETDGLREQNGELVLATGAELPLPDSVLDAVLVRTAPLREQYATAVEVAAVLGVRVDLPTLAGLVDPADVDRLLDANLLTEHSADTAVFRHALARDALYRSIPWARRRTHHREIAGHLTARSAAPETIAEHWIAAHEHDRARPMLLAAAKRYCAVHAYRDAAALGRRALAIWPEGADPGGRLTALASLADCAEMCGEFAAAITTWTELAEARTAHGDVIGAAKAHRRIANAADMIGDWAVTRAAREAAAQAFAAAGDQAAVATERLALAEQLESAGQLTGALDHVVVATEAADAAGRTDLKAIALTLQGSIRAALGEAERGVELARSGLAIALAEHPEAAGRGHYDLAVALLCAADYAAAADAFESGVELCRTHGADDMEQACVACMAVAVRLLGDWDRALTIARQVLASAAAGDVAAVRVFGHAQRPSGEREHRGRQAAGIPVAVGEFGQPALHAGCGGFDVAIAVEDEQAGRIREVGLARLPYQQRRTGAFGKHRRHRLDEGLLVLGEHRLPRRAVETECSPDLARPGPQAGHEFLVAAHRHVAVPPRTA